MSQQQQQQQEEEEENDDGEQQQHQQPPLPEGIPMAKDERVRRRLLRFYRRYAPSRIRHIPAILERYGGDEFKLFRMLARKYKVPVEVTALDYNDGADVRDVKVRKYHQERSAGQRVRRGSRAPLPRDASAPSGWIVALDGAILHAADVANVAECRAQMHWRDEASPPPPPPPSVRTAATSSGVDALLPRVAGLLTVLVAVYAVLGLLLVRRLLAAPRLDPPADPTQRALHFRRLEQFRRRVILAPTGWQHACEGMQATGFHFLTSWVLWLHMVAPSSAAAAETPSDGAIAAASTLWWLLSTMALLLMSAGLAGVALGSQAARCERGAPDPLRLSVWYATLSGPVVVAVVADVAMRTACATFTTLAQVPFVSVAACALVVTAIIVGVFTGYKLGLRQAQGTSAAVELDVSDDGDDITDTAGGRLHPLMTSPWKLDHHVKPFCLALVLSAPAVALLLAEHPAALFRGNTGESDGEPAAACVLTFLLAITLPSMWTSMLFTAWHVLVAEHSDWRTHAVINGVAPAVLLAVVWPLRFGWDGGPSAAGAPSGDAADELRSRLLLPVMVYLMALAGAATAFVTADAVIRGLFRTRAPHSTTGNEMTAAAKCPA